MLYPKKYICVKCGKPFTKMSGGVVERIEIAPVCDKCKLSFVSGIFKKPK